MISRSQSPRSLSHYLVSFSSIFPEEILAFVSCGSVDFALNADEVHPTVRQKTFLKNQAGLTFRDLVNIKQIHGRRVLIVGKKDAGLKTRRKADGLLTAEAGVALTIRTADCLPVFIFDPQQKVIGLVHAGWRGAYKEIVPNAIWIMKRKWNSDPKNLMVAFGPSMQPCCYEVGKKFLRYFPQDTTSREGRLYLNLPLAVKRQLWGLGILKKNIYDNGICTCCDHRFFSYRRQGAKAGRMISVMMQRP